MRDVNARTRQLLNVVVACCEDNFQEPPQNIRKPAQHDGTQIHPTLREPTRDVERIDF